MLLNIKTIIIIAIMVPRAVEPVQGDDDLYSVDFEAPRALGVDFPDDFRLLWMGIIGTLIRKRSKIASRWSDNCDGYADCDEWRIANDKWQTR